LHRLDRVGDRNIRTYFELGQGVARCSVGEFGVFGGIRCDFLRQNDFRETSGEKFVKIGSIDHKFLTGELGVFVESLPLSKLHVLTKLAWRRMPTRKHGDICLLGDGEKSFLPGLYYGDGDAIAGHISVAGELSAAWDWQFSLDGTFSKNSKTYSAAVAFGRKI
jgi:hypothetical protein